MNKSFLFFLFVSIAFLGCPPSNNNNPPPDTPPTDSLPPQDTTPKVDRTDLRAFSQHVVGLLKDKQFQELAGYIHPDDGIRFSPYAYIGKDDVHMSAAQFEELLAQPDRTLNWGSEDGTGDPIKGTFMDYYQEYIYDVDFANPESVSVNNSLAHGNTINNLAEAYPNAEYVEYYFSGFEEQYGGMDWRALRLVYKMHDGQYYLVGVVHDEWTT